MLLFGESRGDEVLGDAVVVDGGDTAVTGAGEPAGALHDLMQDRVQIEAGADPKHGRNQPGVGALRLLPAGYAAIMITHRMLLHQRRAWRRAPGRGRVPRCELANPSARPDAQPKPGDSPEFM